MSRRARTRPSKRRQPAELINPIATAMRRCATLSRDDQHLYLRTMETALREFLRGENCDLHWRSLADSANVAETLSAMGLVGGDDVDDIIERGQAVLAQVIERANARRSWTLYADEIDALRELVWIHGQQLAVCSYGEFERAITTTRNRVAGALSGSPGAGVVVVGQIGPVHSTSEAA